MKKYLSVMGCIAATAVTITLTAMSVVATKSCLDEIAWDNSSQRRQMIEDRISSRIWDPNSKEYEQLCRDAFDVFGCEYIVKIKN